MNKRIAMLLVAILSLALLWGCQKSGGSAVTQQPILGEDVVGYMGFTHLKAYTMTGEDGTVVYLPASEAAYVGSTCVISETQGVEVTINQNPMFGDNMTNKSEKQKLTYALNGTYSDLLTKNMLDLERSDVEELEKGGAFAEVTYLIYDDDNKRHIAYWVGNYYVKLEDGREFQVEIRVNSGAKTEETRNVISELAKYLDITLPYDEAAMKAKIDGYSLDEDEIARMSGETVVLGSMRFYMPEGWAENKHFASKNGFQTSMGKAEELIVYTESGNERTLSKTIFLIYETVDMQSIGAQYGVITEEGRKQRVAGIYQEYLIKAYSASDCEVTLIGMLEHGYVFKVILRESTGEVGVMDDLPGSFDRCLYLVYKADVGYQLEGAIPSNASDEEKQEFFDMVDRVYSSMETK